MIPASTQILDVIHDRLERIKTSNGFSVTVKNVERSKRTKFTVSQKPSINYYALDDLITKSFGTDNHSLPVSIEFIDTTMTEPFNDLAAKRAADIITTLVQDNAGNSSFNLGDLVDTVEINSISPIIDAKDIPSCGVIVDLTIKYKTAVFEPFTII